MAQKSRDILKSYFELGDKPTQEQFSDLIDSLALKTELDSQNISLANKITTNKTETDTKLTELSVELGQYVSNSEYIRAYTDAEGKFLWGIRHDGSIEFAKGVPTPIKKLIEPIVFIKDYLGLLNDIEGRSELTTDADNKVLAYRDANGKSKNYAFF